MLRVSFKSLEPLTLTWARWKKTRTHSWKKQLAILEPCTQNTHILQVPSNSIFLLAERGCLQRWVCPSESGRHLWFEKAQTTIRHKSQWYCDSIFLRVSSFQFFHIFWVPWSSFLCAGFLHLLGWWRWGAALVAVWASHCSGFSRRRAWAVGARASAAVAPRLSCPAACAFFPDQGSNSRPLHWDQGSNSRPLHWQADSSLDHQGSRKT